MSQSIFESIKQTDSHGAEYWSARDLAKVLGYTKWENFAKVIEKARVSFVTAWNKGSDWFLETRKPIASGKWGIQFIIDYALSRDACYIVAQNGDAKKAPIALAQMYFADQTRKQELFQEYIADKNRLEEREKYSETDKDLSSALFQKWLSSPQIATVKSKWQKAFYNTTPENMRRKYGIAPKKPIVDRAPDILITAQSLANQMTAMNVEKNRNLNSETGISHEHITNNSSVRKTLINRWIVPELLPPAEDTKKLPKKIQKFEEGLISNNLLSE